MTICTTAKNNHSRSGRVRTDMTLVRGGKIVQRARTTEPTRWWWIKSAATLLWREFFRNW